MGWMNLLGWSERHSEHKTTLGCFPEDETRIKDGKERLELNRGSESRWTYRIRPIRFIHVRWTVIYALTMTNLIRTDTTTDRKTG